MGGLRLLLDQQPQSAARLIPAAAVAADPQARLPPAPATPLARHPASGDHRHHPKRRHGPREPRRLRRRPHLYGIGCIVALLRTGRLTVRRPDGTVNDLDPLELELAAEVQAATEPLLTEDDFAALLA
jgi:hypothetical protein